MIICLAPDRLLTSVVNRTIEDMQMAAAGIGSPLKKELSDELFSTLNLASLKAPQITYRHAASQPSRLKGSSAHKKARIAGATPKATRSESESYSTPKWLAVPVILATLPSRQSKVAETIIAMAADSNLPWIEAIMAKKPLNRLAEVNRFGRI